MKSKFEKVVDETRKFNNETSLGGRNEKPVSTFRGFQMMNLMNKRKLQNKSQLMKNSYARTIN